MGLFGKRNQEVAPTRVTDSWAFNANGMETTVGMQRRMATDMAERDYRTASERGLALSLLAALDMIEDMATRSD